MSDKSNRQGVPWAFSLTLLMVVGAAAANEELRLVDAAKNQDLPQVRALLSKRPAVPAVNIRSEDGSTALLWAAHWSDLQMAELLVRAGADANTANDLRMTPLSQACTNGNAQFVDLLLKAGANPNTPIGTGETPLMTCARSGSADAVRMLLARGADVNAREPNKNQTALMWAAAQRHQKVVQALIEANADLKAHTKSGFTALHFAARVGDPESIRTLLGAGVDVNIKSQPDAVSGRGQGARGAGAAAAAGPAGAARGVVGGGAGARGDTNFGGSTALLVATVRGHVPLALFLLDQGADPNVLDAGFTPLHWASGTWENGLANPVYGFVDPIGGIPDRDAKLQLVKALLAHGANPNLQMTARPPGYGGTGTGGYNDAAGATPFILAANAADIEMMRILLAAGADPHVVTRTNSNALLAATGLNRGIGEIIDDEEKALAAVNFLIDVGVDLKARTTYNENALFGPAYRGWNRMLELLIEKGAEVNTENRAGVTPWLAASGLGDRLGGVLFNKEGAEILLKHGADPKLGRPCQAQNRCRPE